MSGMVDSACHYRNLAIHYGANPLEMLDAYDRWLCATWDHEDHDPEGWCPDDVFELRADDPLVVENDRLRARVARLEAALRSLRDSAKHSQTVWAGDRSRNHLNARGVQSICDDALAGDES